jgi:hypothetical protein
MTRNKARNMLSDVIRRIDYDIWKQQFNKDTAEEDQDVDLNFNDLLDFVEGYYLNYHDE